MRESGILLPVFSLPSRYGIGCFSAEAREFIDQLARSGQHYWQILPLTPPAEGNSPYTPVSTFAGNPCFIDPESLVHANLLSRADLEPVEKALRDVPEDTIDYKLVSRLRKPLLKKAFGRFRPSHSYERFCRSNAYWLDDVSLYSALATWFREADWHYWPKEIKYREKDAVAFYREHLKWEIEYYKWTQFEFTKEWKKICRYAHKKGIRIIGDMPIYTSMQGADCWAHPEIFQLDEDLDAESVSGCPPDSFSPDGQLWGNPLYDWDGNRDAVFRWWEERVRLSFRLYDIIRIDHFRGLAAYYSIPRGKTPFDGTWIPGPGIDLFRALEKSVRGTKFLAEDLGLITDDVKELLAECGFPGMKVLQFAFDSDETNPYLPDNFGTTSCVVYTGTHDNDTTRGWYGSLDEDKKAFVERVLRKHLQTPAYYCPDPLTPENIAGAMTALAETSTADLCIIPMGDLLNLGSEARINTPAGSGKNWRWRMKPEELTAESFRLIKWLTEQAGRTENADGKA